VQATKQAILLDERCSSVRNAFRRMSLFYHLAKSKEQLVDISAMAPVTDK
jgi:hypothetical protein